MDEQNRAKWEDIDWTNNRLMVRGTKTEESTAWIPLAPVLRDELLEFYKGSQGEFIFPGRSFQTKGKKIYRRTRLFEKITRLTCLNAFMQKHPDVSPSLKLWKRLKAEGYPGGVRLKPKDLRDYFASEVASRVNDPSVVMKLLRHTNLTTTTKYLRVIEERMHEAVKNLGANFRGQSGANSFHKIPDFSNVDFNQESELTGDVASEILNGGGRSRTYDAADMSRVL
jgi:integrase